MPQGGEGGGGFRGWGCLSCSQPECITMVWYCAQQCWHAICEPRFLPATFWPAVQHPMSFFSEKFWDLLPALWV